MEEPQGQGHVAQAREVWALIWSRASRYVVGRLGLALAVVVITAVIAPLSTLALKFLVDGLSAPVKPSFGWLLFLATLYVGTLWIGRVFSALRGLFHTQAERRLYRILSGAFFGHVMRLPFRFHLERRTGAVTESLANGLSGVETALHSTLYSVVPVVIQVATMAIILFSLDEPVVLCVFVVALGLYSAVFRRGARQLAVATDKASTTQVEAGGLLTDGFMNAETVKYFSAEARVAARMDPALARSEAHWVVAARCSARSAILVATVFVLFVFATLYYATSAVVAGTMTLGTFVLINSYMLQLVGPVESLGYSLQELAQSTGLTRQMFTLFKMEPEPLDEDAPADERTEPADLVFENVSAAYRTGVPVLQNVSFTIPAGTTLGVVGASGAGKSTLVRLLLRLVEPESGRLLLDGKPLQDWPLVRLRNAFAVVPQESALFNDTIAYNIGFSVPDASQENVEAAASVADLHEFVRKLPEGYGTAVGERGVKLSGGEKQRLAIARAALRRSRVLVFDEATSSLDSRTERQIKRNLMQISQNRTTLIIAHRLSTIVHADRIVVLDQGVVIEQGTHSELLKRKGRYAELWDAQHEIVELPTKVATKG